MAHRHRNDKKLRGIARGKTRKGEKLTVFCLFALGDMFCNKKLGKTSLTNIKRGVWWGAGGGG